MIFAVFDVSLIARRR